MLNIGYIYKFTLIPTGKIYIGKRQKSKFDPYYWGSGTYWNNAVAAHGGHKAVKREVLEWCQTIEQLNEQEKYWIQKLNARDRNIGYNIAQGGEGGDTTGKATLMINMNTLSIVKEFISVAAAADYVDGLVGAISKACLGGCLSYKGYYWCYKENWYEGWKPRKQLIPGARPIYKVDENTFEAVALYDTIMEASRANCLTKATVVNCAELQHTPINGYYYLYAEDYTDDWGPKPIKVNRHGMRLVIDFEANKEYDSIAAAGRAYNTTPTNVFSCCNNYNYTVTNHHFCYKEDYNKLKEYLEIKQQLEDGMHIICFETKVEYLSCTDVERQTGISKGQISQCCNGKALTAGPDHYHWCYKKDYREDMTWEPGHGGPIGKKVICIETGVIYQSMQEAFRQTGIRHIAECCKGQVKHAGKLPDGTKLTWKYIE